MPETSTWADSRHDWVSEWYDNVQNQASATVVNVGDGERRNGINFVLAKGGRIDGTVTDSNGDAECAQICVECLRPATPPQGVRQDQAQTAPTRSPTSPPGPVVLRFHDCTAPFDYGPEWYDNKLTGQAADTVTVTAGGEVTGIDAQLGRRLHPHRHGDRGQ